ncbi:glycosyltransferase [Herbiconiux sp. SYSU D00978]|uniref:glycosyltransferase n=1 Tax=Herbiconiux sp. SYSU D00978 TaxID=2812562 RepID=UPI001F61F85D|nr:glycosyltransferase [Herbiconiux sp. SYSU D00978]
MTDDSSTAGTAAPLRILIGADTFTPDVNGAAKFTERLAVGLAGRGHDVHVVAPAFNRKHGTFTEVYDGQALTVHRLFSLRWYPHDWLRFAIPFRVQPNTAKILDEFKPDVVHFQSHIVVGRGLVRQAAARGIRIIGTNHFMPENLIEHSLLPEGLRDKAIEIAWKDAAKTFSYAEQVTTPTRKAAMFLEKETHLRGVHAISCGINASDYTADLTPRTENRVVFVGRVTGEKHIHVLLKAVAQMDPELDVKVDIVGSGDQMHQLQQLAVDLGIRSNVHFTGHATDAQLRETLTRGSVFAMPSIAELQSIATMEAMASGLPVVAANAMALPHLVHDGENGYLFQPDTPEDLAAKLTKVLTLPREEYLAMQRESLRIVEAHDIEKTLTTFEKLYRGEPVAD